MQESKSDEVVTFLEARSTRSDDGQCASMACAGVDRITNVTHSVNQRRVTDLSSQSANEHFDQLRIVLVRVFPNTFAQLGAREDTGRLAH